MSPSCRNQRVIHPSWVPPVLVVSFFLPVLLELLRAAGIFGLGQERRVEQSYHVSADTFRGRELGVAATEAFVALARDSRPRPHLR
jgi:hypothetical protein